MIKKKFTFFMLIVLSMFQQISIAQNEWTILATYDVPGKASGLAWDGTYLYYGIYGSAGSDVYRFDPASGTAQLQFSNPQIGDSYGMTYDGEHLWIIDRGNTGNAFALKLSLDGNTLGQIGLPQQYMSGIAADGTDLWVSSYYPDPGWIYKVDASGNVLHQHVPPMAQTWDLALGNENEMWIVDYNGNMVFKTDLEGNILEEHPSITQRPAGIVFDGTYLWYVAGPLSGISTLYKVDPGGAGAPQISISQTSFDFGNVTVGTTAYANFDVSNTGSGSLEISFVQPSPESEVVLPGGTFTINAGETLGFGAAFSPSTHQYMSTSAILNSNDPLQSSTTLSFIGTALEAGPFISCSPETHAFNNVRTLGSRKQEIMVQNWGNETLSVSDLMLEHPHFYLSDTPVMPFQLAPLGSFHFNVWFYPQESGNFETSLNIQSNAGNYSTYTIDLSGTATESFFPIGGTIWESQIEDPYDSSPKAIVPIQDISGDGKADVIVASEDDIIRAFNGNASDFGQVLWEREIYSGSVYQQQALITAGDINEDGIEDIIVGTAWGDRSVVALCGKTGQILWKFQTNMFGDGGWVYEVNATFDYNGDGFEDVLAATGNDGTNTGPKRVFCLNGKTGQMIWNYSFNGAVFAVKGMQDVNADGIADVIAGGTNSNESQGRLVAISGSTGYQLWEMTVSGTTAYALQMLDDINADGIPEIMSGTFNGHLYLIDPTNGNVLHQNYLGNTIILKLIAMGDLNGDGFIDIVPAHSGYNVAAINGFNGEYIWSESVPDKPWNLQGLPDISGDAVNDIALGTLYQNNYAMFLDGASGQQLFSESFGEAIDAIGTIPDVNGDDSWEMVAGGRNGKLVCYAGGPDGITGIGEVERSANETFAFPNPFSNECQIQFTWHKSADVSISIYNIHGTKVFQSSVKVASNEPHLWYWDAKALDGNKLPQGVYLLQLSDGQQKQVITLLHTTP